VIKAESDYYPWGGELQFVNDDSNHYKFTGKERDSETGLDYFGARYYSNGLGRWVSADWSATPIPVPYADFGDPQSLNLYGYVRGLPTTKADLDGHGFWAKLGNRFGDADCWCEGKEAEEAKERARANKEAVAEFARNDPRARESMVLFVMFALGDAFASLAPVDEASAGVRTDSAGTAGTRLVSGPTGAGAEGAGAGVPKKEVPESIPAGPSPRPTAAQQRAINEMGEEHGCHTCGATTPGTKSGNWVGDHQPSTAVNPPGSPQVYKPQCLSCSLRQGGQVRAAQAKSAAAARRAADAAKEKDHTTN